jgi:hypothetical protein
MAATPLTGRDAQKSMIAAIRYESLTRRAAKQSPMPSPMAETSDMIIADQ